MTTPTHAANGVLARFAGDLRDPRDGTPVAAIENGSVRFRGGGSYPCIDGVPILIDESASLFRIADIVAQRPVIQDRDYRDLSRLKNYVRRKVLPALSVDRGLDAAHDALAREAAGKPVLVLGSGDRVAQVRQRFHRSPIAISDVHLQFGAEIVLDGHRIPFRDGLFGLVLASQVLEHTVRPWQVAEEIQRVTAIGGTIQIEVPFAFPYHSQPYDFFRFTPSSLRVLFEETELVELRVAEGAGGAAATFLGQMLIDKFRGRSARRLALLASRLGLWWLKYLDRLPTHDLRTRVNAPKGFAATFRKDGRARTEQALVAEVADRFCAR